jgi:probable metal-binding protein
MGCKMPSIHGHDLMDMMIETGKSYSTEALVAAAKAEFGEEALFHTCSFEGLNPEKLIELLVSKGKFNVDEKGEYSIQERLCQH